MAALWGLVAGWALAADDFGRRFEEIKRAATPAQLYAFLYEMPKGGDLHSHLSGSVLADWWLAAGTDPQRNGGDRFYTRRLRSECPRDTAEPPLFQTIRRHTWLLLPECQRGEYVPLDQLNPAEREEWLSSLRLDRPGEGRREFFEVIWDRIGELDSNPHVVADILLRNLKAFGAEGLRYLETSFSARNLSDNDGRPIPDDAAVNFFRERLASPEARATGVTVRFLRTPLRYAPAAEKDLEAAYAFVDRYRDLWVGINLAGLEERPGGEPLRFLDTFRRLRRTYSGIHLSLHAGEMDRPDRHVRDSLLLGAERIGHGINLLDDPDTLLLLRGGRQLVEIQLVSNRLLEYRPDLREHPFPEYLRTGVPVCLNTDDRGAWDSNLTDEYYTAVTLFNLSWAEIVQLGRDSLRFAFADPGTKARLLAGYEQALAAFEAKYLPEGSLRKLEKKRPEVSGYARRTWGLKTNKE